MDELKACPFCGSSNTTLDYYEISCPQELGTIVVCNDCGASAKSIVDWNTRPIEDALNARIAELEAENERLSQLLHDEMSQLRAELEKRTAGLHYANAVCMEMKHELVRRDEIIARLKEDAERLATRAVYWDDYGNEYECIHLECSGHSENILFDLAPDRPITLHRALMKELE